MSHDVIEAGKQAAKKAEAIRPRSTMVEQALDALITLGTGGLVDRGSKGSALGGLLAAGVPILGGKKAFQFWHDIPDLEKLAGGGGGLFRTYHGTTAENAAKILRQGIKLPRSGEEAAREVVSKYGLPWVEWQKNVPWSGYGDETARLSTAPYPVAARWAQHFPQGEVKSQLNAQARILAEAKRRGMPYDQVYEDVYNLAQKRGIKDMYEGPTTAGLPDLMKPSERGGAVLGVDTDIRAIPAFNRKDAEYLLKDMESGNISPLEALEAWNLGYKDIKLAPQNVKNLELVKRFLRGEIQYPR